MRVMYIEIKYLNKDPLFIYLIEYLNTCLENFMDRGYIQSMGMQKVRHDWVTNILLKGQIEKLEVEMER